MIRFTKFALAALIALACAACIAVVDRPLIDPQPILQLTQVRPDPNDPVVYGPVTVEYELTVYNPSPRPITLRAVDLSSVSGYYTVAHQSRRMHRTIAPYETISTRIFVSAWSNGSQASAYEPVTLRGVAWFDTAHARRQRVTFDALP